MSVTTSARFGLARLGATRFNYPILAGVRVPKYALFGVARLGATRLNYHSPQTFVAINGIHYATARAVDAQQVDNDTLTISDTLNETPNTAACSTSGFIPVEGQAVIITLGSKNNLQREFGGQILSATARFVGTPGNYHHDLGVIDYTWGLNKRKVRARYTSTTVAVVAASLISTYAAGYTVQIAADIGAEAIDEITFTEQDLTSALTQLFKRVGGDWVCDYHQVVKGFYTDPSVTQPTILNAVHPTLLAFQATRDLSQLITRVYVEGGGVNALAPIAVGETTLPVEDGAYYQASGGVVVAGPQRISYTARSLGGGGSLVGPGAAPSGAPVVAAAGGAGVETGAHSYAVTFVTAAGESIAGPLASITVGVVPAPASAPTAGAPTIGSGPNTGSHDYAVTFVTAAGETTASPSATKATGETPEPATAPTPGTPTVAGNVDVGLHEYAVTFVTSIGETTPGPISGSIDAGLLIANPSVAPTWGGYIIGSQTIGRYDYAYTFVSAAGETTPSPALTLLTDPTNHGMRISSIALGPTGTTARKLYRTAVNGVQLKLLTTIANNTVTLFNDTFDDTGLGANAPTVNTAAVASQIPLTAIPLGDANVTSRKLYRRSGGLGLKLLTTIANNTATTYTDTTANASLGAAVPSVSTATLNRIALSAIPTSPSALVISRNLYRTAAGGAQLKFLATIGDNTTTTYADTTTDAGLGANVPTSNTATANQVALSAIPIGAATVTSRKLHRTAAGGAQLKFLATLGDNVTTTYADSIADGSLGANVPTSDTSGLAQPSGQVLAGATALIVAGTGAFRAAGGWAVIGNGAQVIRYTGITGSTLSGIPSTGNGAIVASIGYNSTVTAAPMLTGIPASGPGAIGWPLLKGDPINLFVQVDDIAAQTALALLIGGDGIQEETLQDRRLSFTEATARGEAHLALRRDVAVSLRYTTRDINTRAGRTIAVNLGSPFNLVASFMIQSVTVSDFTPALNPRYDVTAAATHLSFDDLLKAIHKAT